jgi:hypothetical protein
MPTKHTVSPPTQGIAPPPRANYQPWPQIPSGPGQFVSPVLRRNPTVPAHCHPARSPALTSSFHNSIVSSTSPLASTRNCRLVLCQGNRARVRRRAGKPGLRAALAELTALARVSSHLLSPIPVSVPPEVRDFVETMRLLFRALGSSLKQLAASLAKWHVRDDPGPDVEELPDARLHDQVPDGPAEKGTVLAGRDPGGGRRRQHRLGRLTVGGD